jgi:mannosylglycerate hydrolase
VENIAKDHRLRVHFSAPISVREADHDGHFEVVRRPLGVPQKGEDWVEDPRPEVPQRAFTDVSNGEIGLTIANRGLPEVEVFKGDNGAHTEIALTLLRCVGWLSRDDMPVRQGHAGPAFETPGGQVPGKWGFDYAIIPHKGDWRESYLHAYAFQTTLCAIETGIHTGDIHSQGTFISSSSGAFIISAVKANENGKGWLVRGYNISSDTIQLGLKPLRRFSHAALVNLAEEEISPLPIADEVSVAISATGHKIISVMFTN